MSYKPYYTDGWKSGEAGGTPITPEALNHMDGGIRAAHEAAAAVEAALKTKRLYHACGLLWNSDGGVSQGYGIASVEINENGLVRIDFNIKIAVAGTNSSNFAVGLNRDLLRTANANIPVITPYDFGPCNYYSSAGSLVSGDTNGHSGVMAANSQDKFWRPSRMYTTAGAVGWWAETKFTVGMRITGTCFGTVNL